MSGTPLHNKAGRTLAKPHPTKLPALLPPPLPAQPLCCSSQVNPVRHYTSSTTTASVYLSLLNIELQQCTWHQSYSTAAVRGDNTTQQQKACNSRWLLNICKRSSSQLQSQPTATCRLQSTGCCLPLATWASSAHPLPSHVLQQRSKPCAMLFKHKQSKAMAASCLFHIQLRKSLKGAA